MFLQNVRYKFVADEYVMAVVESMVSLRRIDHS